MRTDKQRIAKYIAKTDPATVRLKVAAMLPIMMANYAAHVNEIAPSEEAAGAWLARELVTLLDRYPSLLYLNFARELWKGKKKYSGAKLVSYAQWKKTKRLARGLNDEVMKKLALDLFGITLT